jgi:hypothetical protein
LLYPSLRSFIMTSSKFTLAAVAITLALGTAAYAKGPMNGQAGGAVAGAGTGASAGAGTRTQTQARTQAHTQEQAEAQIRARLQTMSADRVPGTGVAGAGAADGTPRGIHTPGTGLTTPTTTDSSVVVVQ